MRPGSAVHTDHETLTLPVTMSHNTVHSRRSARSDNLHENKIIILCLFLLMTILSTIGRGRLEHHMIAISYRSPSGRIGSGNYVAPFQANVTWLTVCPSDRSSDVLLLICTFRTMRDTAGFPVTHPVGGTDLL